MRKIKGMSVLVIILTVFLLVTGVNAQNDINVIVNDMEVSFDQTPVIESGKTLVPLRAIFEALGAEVDWQAETQTVTGIKEETQVSLQINNKIATVNGEQNELDVPAMLIGGRTLGPVRFISESMGAARAQRDRFLVLSCRDIYL